MITQIRHTGLVVADLESALCFWCNLLGFSIVKRMDESGPHINAMMGLQDVRVTTVKLAAPDGNLIELLHFNSHPDKPAWTGTPYSTGFTHIALLWMTWISSVKSLPMPVSSLTRCHSYRQMVTPR